MINTEKKVCRELAAMLAQYGIEDVVLSPGNRNAPLIMAVVRNPALNHRVVVDERSAAFVAMGMASQTGKAVALVCTSGTAVLNYAPAVAEAFYREVPLVVISADRPSEWIDQDDSQTIVQENVLRNIVKASFNIPVETGSDTQMWMVNRMLNDALSQCVSDRPGPVHINIQIDTPLTAETYAEVVVPRKIEVVQRQNMLPRELIRQLAQEVAAEERVLIVAGFLPPNQKLSKAIGRLASRPNVAVLTEAQANIHASGVHCGIDGILCRMTREQRPTMRPSLLITIGGSLVSSFIKPWLRGKDGFRHWHVGIRGNAVDCFQRLEKRIEIPAQDFIPQLAGAMPRDTAANGYGYEWNRLDNIAQEIQHEYLKQSPWCDLTATQILINNLPVRANFHSSNGMSVRYLQMADYQRLHKVDCNRGASGIDGCTSTAVGAASMYGDLTVLLTGDMSAQYDLGALACTFIPSTFRMAVLNNGGGSIFHYVKSTAGLPEREECFVTDVRLPLKELAQGFGLLYLEADSENTLKKALKEFCAPQKKPVLLNIKTDGVLSAEVLKLYFKFKR